MAKGDKIKKLKSLREIDHEWEMVRRRERQLAPMANPAKVEGKYIPAGKLRNCGPRPFPSEIDGAE